MTYLGLVLSVHVLAIDLVEGPLAHKDEMVVRDAARLVAIQQLHIGS